MEDYFQEMYTFWRCASCPKCGEDNWIYDSHSQRHYPRITDGCQCWSCKHKFFLGEKLDFECRYAGELEDHTIEQVFEDYFDCDDGIEDPRR